MSKKELLDMLIENLKEYRGLGIMQSVKRNSHMNDIRKTDKMPQRVIDAILVDFINFVGRWQGVDLGLYTKHLDEVKNG